jgi:hypothetical protein
VAPISAPFPCSGVTDGGFLPQLAAAQIVTDASDFAADCGRFVVEQIIFS